MMNVEVQNQGTKTHWVYKCEDDDQRAHIFDNTFYLKKKKVLNQICNKNC